MSNPGDPPETLDTISEVAVEEERFASLVAYCGVIGIPKSDIELYQELVSKVGAWYPEQFQEYSLVLGDGSAVIRGVAGFREFGDESERRQLVFVSETGVINIYTSYKGLGKAGFLEALNMAMAYNQRPKRGNNYEETYKIWVPYGVEGKSREFSVTDFTFDNLFTKQHEPTTRAGNLFGTFSQFEDVKEVALATADLDKLHIVRK